MKGAKTMKKFSLLRTPILRRALVMMSPLKTPSSLASLHRISRLLRKNAFHALAFTCALLAGWSCTRSPDEVTELEFTLADTLVGAYDSVRIELFSDGEMDGEPLFSKTFPVEDDQGKILLKLPKGLPENFTAVVTGFEGDVIAKRIRYDYDLTQETPVGDPIAILINSDPDPDPTLVTLEAENVDCQVGDSTQALVRVIPTDWPDTNYSLSSANEDKATVQGHSVYCLEAGESKITATLEDASVEFTVKVLERVVFIASFGVKDLGVLVDQTVDPEISFEPSDATSTGFSVEVVEGDAAEIDTTRKIHGLKPGEVTVRVKANQGDAEATFKVTVSDEEVLSESFSSPDLSLPIFGSHDPDITVSPDNATSRDFSLTSDDEEIVRVEDGVLKARKIGKVTLRIKAQKGDAEGSFEVTVRDPVFADIKPVSAQWCGNCHAPGRTFNLQDSSVFIAKGAQAMRRLTLAVGDSGRMPLDTVMDEDPKAMLLAWLSANVHPVTAITVTDISVAVGDTTTPSVVFEPENATNQVFTLESAQPAFAKAVGNRLVGIAEGSANIKVTTEDGAFEKTFKVTVVRPGFMEHIKPVTTEKCGDCHGPSITFDLQDSVILLSHGKESLRRIQLEKSNSARMPAQGELTERELTLLLTWLKAYFVPLANLASPDLKLRLGETVLPPVTFTPPNASNRGYSLTTLDTTVVASPDGVRLSGLKIGSTQILLASVEGPLNRSFKVDVTPWLPESVVGLDTAVGVGDSVRLTVKVFPPQATDTTYTLTALTNNISINAEGFVKGVTLGDARILAQSTGDTSVTDTIKVSVAAIVDESITVDNVSLLVGNSAVPVVHWTPLNTTNKNFALTIKSGAAVSLKGTAIIGEESGESILTATSIGGGHSADFTVTVGNVVATGIRLSVPTVVVGTTVRPTAAFTPTNTTQKTFSLTSLTASVLKISTDGTQIQAMKLGSADIIATAKDGPKDTVKNVKAIMPPFATAQKVITAKCMACHGGRTSVLADSASAVTYGSQVYDRINRATGAAGFMPQGGSLTAAELKAMNEWFQWLAAPIIKLPIEIVPIPGPILIPVTPL
jgi:uncharacterized protein YjdB